MTKEEKKAIDRAYYLKNRERIIKKSKEYAQNNEGKVKVFQKKYREENKDYFKEYGVEYRKENLEDLKQYDKDRANNPDRVKAKLDYNKSDAGKKQRRKTRKTTIHDKWRALLNNCLQRIGTKKEGSTSELLGYSAIQLKYHIEQLFTEGMSWENHGEWHIDHKVPVSSFPDNTPLNQINSLSNLQPLWKTNRIINGTFYQGNLNKGNKII